MAEKWIQKAINPKNKGALRKKLGVKTGHDIAMSELKKAEKSKSPVTRRQATLAMTLKKMNKK